MKNVFIRFLQMVLLIGFLCAADQAQNQFNGETQADPLRAHNGQPFLYFCPPDGTFSTLLWGIDLYLYNSPICAAAHISLAGRPEANPERIDVDRNPGYAINRKAFPVDDETVKAAIIKEITEYLSQFKGACFAETISIGNPDAFQAAINKNVRSIFIGKAGDSYIAARGSTAMSLHHTWKGVGMTANLAFRFDPQTMPALPSGYEDRQRLVHELTHHIEFNAGVKESSTTLLGNENPRSERNANYQDKVVNALKTLVTIENLPKREMGKLVSLWQAFETELGKLKKGSSAGMTPPDDDLEAMTGFRVKFESIENRYLNKNCGVDLQNMVLLSRELPNFSPILDFTKPSKTKPGQSETVKAGLLDINKQEVDLSVTFSPRYVWTMPDGNVITGNPAVIAPVKGDNNEVLVQLFIPFNGKEYLLADAGYKAAVAPGEPAPAANNFYEKYQGRLKGDLNGTFEFAVAKTDKGDQLISGRISAGNVEREIVGVLSKTGEFLGALVDKALGADYRNYTRGSFSGKITGKSAAGTWDTWDTYRPGTESAHWKGDWQTGAVEEQPFRVSVYRGGAFVAENPPTDWTTNPDAAKWKTLRTDEKMNINPNVAFAVRTPAEAGAAVTDPDGLTFVVKSNTSVYFLRKVIRIKVGEVYFNEQKIDSSFKIMTPTSEGGVFGTQLLVRVEPDATTAYFLLQGAVEVSDLKKTKKIILRPNQTTVVKTGGVPSTPTAFDPTTFDRWWEKSGSIVADSTPTPVVTIPTGTEIGIFTNMNGGGVNNSPTVPTQFTISKPHIITYLLTYHWNNARGTSSPGTISLKASNGTIFGPWATTGLPGQGDVPNAFWETRPNIVIPAETYTILDSNPATWAQNGESGGRGHAMVKGYAAGPSTAGEVEGTGENLAKGRPANQSSISEWSNPNDAQGAVDGVKNGSFGFHTGSEPNPWWQVDLGTAKPITEVRIFNRLDSNPERSRTIQVLVSNDGKSWTRVFANDGRIFGGSDGNPLRVLLKGTRARFVRLQLAETNYFHLDEVEIY